MPPLQSDLEWVTADDAEAINAEYCQSTNEPHQLIDRGKLEGALARPKSAFFYEGHEDLLHLAVVTLFAVANAHAFLQANKRTGFQCARLFLRNHGLDFDDRLDTIMGTSGEPIIAELIISVINGEIEQWKAESFLERFVVEYDC